MSREASHCCAEALLGELADVVGPQRVAVAERPGVVRAAPAPATAPSGAKPACRIGVRGRRSGAAAPVGRVQLAARAQRRSVPAGRQRAGEHARAGAAAHLRRAVRAAGARLVRPPRARPDRAQPGSSSATARDGVRPRGSAPAGTRSSAAASRTSSPPPSSRCSASTRCATRPRGPALSQEPCCPHRRGQRRVALASPGSQRRTLSSSIAGAASGRRSPWPAAPRSTAPRAPSSKLVEHGEVAVVVGRAAPVRPRARRPPGSPRRGTR